MMWTSSRILVLCFFAGLAACDGEPVLGETEAEVGTDDSGLWTELAAVAYEPSWDRPACLERSTNPPGLELEDPSQCAGPWRYERRKTVDTGDAEHCDPEYKNCRDWGHGCQNIGPNGPYGDTDTPSRTYADPYTPPQQVRNCWRYCNDGTQEVNCEPTSCDVLTPENYCAGKATLLKNELIQVANDSEGGCNTSLFDVVVQTVSTPGVPHNWHSVNGTRSFWTWTETTTCTLDIKNGPRATLRRTEVCGVGTIANDGCLRCDYGPAEGHTCSHPHPELAATAPGGPKPSSSEIYPGRPVLCTTCDDKKLSDGAEAKYDCLKTRWLGVGSSMWVDARLRLLLALAADRLPVAKRDAILELYDFTDEMGEDPLRPTCEDEPLPISAACRYVGPPIGHVDACRSLGMNHAKPAASNNLLSFCLGLVSTVDTMPAGACRDEYRNALGNIIVADGSRAFRLIKSDTPSVYRSTLTNAMVQADTIYKKLIVLSDGDEVGLRAFSSPLLAGFFGAAHEGRVALPAPGFDPTWYAALAAEGGRNADVEMLKAAFTASPDPLTSPLIVGVLADGLRATAEHAELLTQVGDASCHYLGCGPEDDPVVPTPVLDFWRIIAALPDATQLRQAVDGAGKLATDVPELAAAFDAIADGHARLAAVLPFPVGDGEDRPDLLPAGGEEILQLIRQARRYLGSYQQSGIAMGGGEYPMLAARPHNEELARTTLRGRIAGAGGLTEKITNMNSARVGLINTLVQQIQGGQETSNTNTQHELISNRLSTAFERQDALLLQQVADEKLFAEVLKGLEDMMESGALDPNEAFDVQDVTTSNNVSVAILSGAESAYQVSMGSNFFPALVAAPRQGPKWVVNLRPGEQLRFSIGAKWSPICALSNPPFTIRVPPPPLDDSLPLPVGAIGWDPENNTLEPVQVQSTSSALCGPEGFMLVSSAQGVRAESVSDSVGTNLGYGLNFRGNGGGTQWERHHTHSSTGSTAISAQFEMGLRIPGRTPYGQAPAGSLLAVLVEAGAPTVIRDIYVLHSNSVITAPKHPDPNGSYNVYLVVNDNKDCNSPALRKLEIAVHKVKPFGEIAIELGEAMADSQDHAESHVPLYVQAGVFTPTAQASLKSYVWQQLESRIGDLNQAPALRDLYNAWMDREIASIDRRVQLGEIARSIKELGLEQDGLVTDLLFSRAKSRLLTLLPRTMLRHLDQTALDLELRDVFESLNGAVPPLFKIRHPNGLEAFRTSHGDQMLTLRGLGFRNDIETVAEGVADFGLDVVGAMEFHEGGDELATRRIILAYPRPGICAGTTLPQRAWKCTESQSGHQEFEEFRVPSEEAIRAVWDGLESNRRATLSIGAADVYETDAEASRLTCGDHAPVIRRTMLIAHSNNGDPNWEGSDFGSNAIASIENHYPTSNGSLIYRMIPDSNTFRFKLGAVDSVLDLTEQWWRDYLTPAGAGLSPVNDFEIELENLEQADFDKIDALYLVMEVETQTTAPPVAIPGICELP